MVDLCDPYEGATMRADMPCRQQQKWHPMGLRAAERTSHKPCMWSSPLSKKAVASAL